jgi:uncharacterized protein (DUF58 family)
MRRRSALAVVVALTGLALAGAAAYANTVTGRQNPQFRVTVTITPDHPVVGDTVVATVRIVNLTRHNHRGSWEVAWLQPDSGISAAMEGVLFRPGVVLTDREHAKVTSDTPPGKYTISASIRDKSRGRSHASASATFSP